MELFNLILDLYGTSEEKQQQVCSRILASAKNYTTKELVKLIISLTQTNLANNHLQQAGPVVRSEVVNDLLNLLVANNKDRLQESEESKVLLIEALLQDKLQDSMLKIFLKHQFSLAWVDDFLQDYPYPTRIQALIQMTKSQFSVGMRAAQGKKFTKEHLMLLLGSKKNLQRIYEEKIFNEETNFLATGLIELIEYNRHFKFNYDVLCREIESSEENSWENIPRWSSVLLALKPLLNDKKLLQFLKETEDSFFLIDSAAMVKNMRQNNSEVVIEVPSSLKEFHAYLIDLTRKHSSPNHQFVQEEILAWEGEDVNERLKVHVPLSTEELKWCGGELNICVGHAGYDKKIIFGKSNVFFLMEGERPLYCIEISKREDQTWKVIQAKGKRNSSLPPEVDWDLRVFLSVKNNPIVS